MNSRFHDPLPVNILRGIVPVAWEFDGQVGFAYQDDGGVFTDDTVDANDAGAGDVALLPAVEAVDDAFYFGENFSTSSTFNGLNLNISQAAIGDTLAWEYYNGAAWVALPCIDGTSGLTVAGTNTVRWTTPADMGHVAVNGQDRYWVRIRVTAANITQQPLATQIWLGRFPESLTNTTDGDVSTTSTQATVLTGAAQDYGNIVFDLGSVKTVLFGARVGVWSTAGAAVVLVSSSNDGVTYTNNAPSVFTVTSVTEAVGNITAKIVSGRYIRITMYVGAAATAHVKFYEAYAYEMGS